MSLRSAGSLELENQRLREEVRELREEVRRLTLKVDRQGDQLQDLSAVVGSLEGSVEPSQISTANASSVPSATSAAGSASLAPEEGPPYSWTYREAVAKQIGQFLRRSLAGEHRGESGRQKLKGLQNRLYVVVRDFDGHVCDPVVVTAKYSRVKELCESRGSFGDSIFVGFASQREAALAVQEGGFSWPQGQI